MVETARLGAAADDLMKAAASSRSRLGVEGLEIVVPRPHERLQALHRRGANHGASWLLLGFALLGGPHPPELRRLGAVCG
jgi:hypothetical protein